MSKFDKYKGTKDPKAHLQYFYTHYQEFMHNDNYLMRLFPRSLQGIALDWFMGLKKGSIKSFAQLLEDFVSHFSFNLEKDIDTLDLLKEKQWEEETFVSYLQRWKALASRMKPPLREKDMVTLFIKNSHPDMAHNFKLHYVTTFVEIIEKGPILERALIAKGLVKIFNYCKEKLDVETTLLTSKTQGRMQILF